MESNDCIARELRIERYKLVTSRQMYLVDLIKDIFKSYAHLLAAAMAGTIALLAASDEIGRLAALNNIKHFATGDGIYFLIQLLAIFVTLAATLSTIQILICLFHWWEYRTVECKINQEAPPPKVTALFFEAMYVLAILASIIIIWWAFDELTS